MNLRHTILLVGGVLALGPYWLCSQDRDPFYDARMNMVDDYCVAEGITNSRVLFAMRNVKRHLFVKSFYEQYAYNDTALEIGYGQTISPPFIVAYMTESIDPQPEDKVLEIGTGSGYQAAVLGKIVKEVYSIEIVEPLGRAAGEKLKELGYDNVKTKVGDGYQGWEEYAPFDKIIVTCSPEKVPQPLVDQLKEGGKMIIPLGERYQQVFYLLEKENGVMVEKKLIPTLFVPMTGLSEKRREVKPDPDRPVLYNGSFEDDENDDGKPDNWHYQRQLRLYKVGGRDGNNLVRFFNLVPGRPAQALQGMAVNGRKIGKLRFRVEVAYENLRPGVQTYEKPGISVYFYDHRRKLIGTGLVGPWLGHSDWRRVSADVTVPEDAREMVISVGLNGGTGRLLVDDIRMTSQAR